ncbi:MAG: mitochondrial fission ELM1 family protein [Hyphomicrobiaceae bacterium]|nr:mitochondrial fission ELM1 family protein [Hyphomicrobiaceae bacterium]
MAGTRPLEGLRGWIITDDKAGMQVQARGVAEALGLDYEARQVAPKGLWRFAAPYGPPDPRDGVGPGRLLAPPWPDVAIATGRLSIPYVRALKRLAGPGTFTVVLQDPKTSARTSDLIWVPEHDRRRGANVVTTLTAPHGFSPARLAALAATPPVWLAALPRPRIAVVLGGKNAVYRFTDADDDRLEASLASLARLGASFLVTPSRRSHQRLVRAADRATSRAPRFFWDGNGDNPYPSFLAHADLFVVTGDSVNMTGEPLATGKPVYVFEPSGGSAKFRRFHEALRRYGATRPLPAEVKSLEGWTYRPLDSAAEIARAIEARVSRRRAMLAGLVGTVSERGAAPGKRAV